MPLPLLPIAAGLFAGGLLARAANKPPRNNWRVDGADRYRTRMDELMDPNSAVSQNRFRRFERLAADSAPTFDTMRSLQRASGVGRGTSNVLANVQVQQGLLRAGETTLNAFSDDMARQETAAMGWGKMFTDTETFRLTGEAGDRVRRWQHGDSLLKGVQDIGTTMLGNYAGNAMDAMFAGGGETTSQIADRLGLDMNIPGMGKSAGQQELDDVAGAMGVRIPRFAGATFDPSRFAPPGSFIPNLNRGLGGLLGR